MRQGEPIASSGFIAKRDQTKTPPPTSVWLALQYPAPKISITHTGHVPLDEYLDIWEITLQYTHKIVSSRLLSDLWLPEEFIDRRFMSHAYELIIYLR